ncbi:MAG: DUF3109 family protein [Verrucomicrobiota bacterium JB023]|nr:DUF3109 family protein [Verrucomicrobiota bacterium JB023]
MAETAYERRESELRENLADLVVDEGALATPLRTCDLSRCRGMCCHDGVYLGHEEREVIERRWGSSVCEQREGRWKTKVVPAGEEELGEGYPAHFPATRCIFLDENNLCQLQKRAGEEGKHPWFYKPMPCWLHPLTIVRLPNGRPMLTLPTAGDDPQAKEGYPGFASCTTCGVPASGQRTAREVLAPEIDFLMKILGRTITS